MIALSQELWHVVAWRAVTGLGSALIVGNANAILAAAFPPEERGRAYALPIIGSRVGTLSGLIVFGLALQLLSWRLIFAAFIPLGLIALAAAFPILKHRDQPRSADATGPVDWLGGGFLAATAIVLILSGSHLHGGEESFVSSDGLGYHIPMHALFLLLLAAFIVVERTVANPMVDLRHFRVRPFSLSLGCNVAYHSSMLATFTLVPILVEEGFGKSPIFVTYVLLPSQSLGLFMPLVAGWIYDKYHPAYLRPVTLAAIAGGFVLLSAAAPHVSFWALPLLLFPIAVGTNMFNPINNATVMNSLPLEHRGVASGMLETSRELGHALGATAAAGALALALPAGIDLVSDEVAQGFMVRGFQASTTVVVFVLLFGTVLAYFHGAPGKPLEPASPSASLEASGDG
jgi:MFS family permease